jgi:hypothetical protein
MTEPTSIDLECEACPARISPGQEVRLTFGAPVEHGTALVIIVCPACAADQTEAAK